jgi:hypothetical protein
LLCGCKGISNFVDRNLTDDEKKQMEILESAQLKKQQEMAMYEAAQKQLPSGNIIKNPEISMQQLAQMNSETYGNTKEMRQPASLEMDTKDAKRLQVLGQITNKLPQKAETMLYVASSAEDYEKICNERYAETERKLSKAQEYFNEKESEIIKLKKLFDEARRQLAEKEDQITKIHEAQKIKDENIYIGMIQTIQRGKAEGQKMIDAHDKTKSELAKVTDEMIRWRDNAVWKDGVIKKLENDVANLRKTVANLQQQNESLRQQLINFQSQNAVAQQQQYRSKGRRF